MKKRKILVITGTRAEYGLLKSTIDEILASKKLELNLLVTGMHTLKKYGHTMDEIKKDRIPISGVVEVGESDFMLISLTKEIAGIEKYCETNRPDLILVLGDRDEPFAAAIVGGHLGIPIAHIFGGDVTGGVVDDYIRDSITKFAHLHFTVSKQSYKRVIKLDEEKWRVFNVGAPNLDNLRKQRYLSKQELAKKFNLDINKKWFLFIQHPAPLENVSVKNQIIPSLKVMSKYDAEKIIIYPNSDTGSDIIIEEISKYKNKKNYHINKNLSRIIYLSLFSHCDLLLGNSSSGVIESGYFKLPVINIGGRQLGRECGKNVLHVDYNEKEIHEAIRLSFSEKFKEAIVKIKNPYGNGVAGKKIVQILENTAFNLKLLIKKRLC